MLVNRQYTGIISSIEKDGRGFTSNSGTKYTNYCVKLEGNVSSFQMAVPSTLALDAGDEIRFTLKLDKKKKLRLYDVEITKYEIKFPLRVQPTYIE